MNEQQRESEPIAINDIAHLYQAESIVLTARDALTTFSFPRKRSEDNKQIAISIAESQQRQIKWEIRNHTVATPGYIQEYRRLKILTVDLKGALTHKMYVGFIGDKIAKDLFEIRDKIVERNSTKS